MPADQREQAINNAVKFAPPITYATVVIARFLDSGDRGGGDAWRIQFAGRNAINFKVALAIVSFSWIPLAIHGLLSLILLFVKSPDTIDLEHLVASDVGAFPFGDSPKMADVAVHFAQLCLRSGRLRCGLGFSAASPKKVSIREGD